MTGHSWSSAFQFIRNEGSSQIISRIPRLLLAYFPSGQPFFAPAASLAEDDHQTFFDFRAADCRSCLLNFRPQKPTPKHEVPNSVIIA